MPYGMSTLNRIAEVTGYKHDRLKGLLKNMADKGLVLDIGTGDKCQYILSPLVIGIYEFTMMRTKGELNHKEWARLFHEYLSDKNTFYAANLSHNEKISPLRTLPHEEAIDESEYVEILDYEKASAIVDDAKKFAVGICSCRHEKYHLGQKECNIPLETCSTFDASADYLIRHDMAKEISKGEMLDLLAKSKEMGLVFCADNVQKNISFICHCCGCCCNVLLGISRFGYPNMVVTSNYIAQSDSDNCSGCGTCVTSCPIVAIKMKADDTPEIDKELCIGCGVCALNCETGAMKLTHRKQRVLHPETTFEKIILQCLERGTLQNFLFNNPGKLSHSFMRAVVGGFLRLPPVKKSLMSDLLRSRFLNSLTKVS